jgi:hypothetical protein
MLFVQIQCEDSWFLSQIRLVGHSCSLSRTTGSCPKIRLVLHRVVCADPVRRQLVLVPNKKTSSQHKKRGPGNPGKKFQSSHFVQKLCKRKAYNEANCKYHLNNKCLSSLLERNFCVSIEHAKRI